MDIRPVDLPELRDETRKDVAANYPAIYEAAIRSGIQFWKPTLSPGPAAVHMVNSELARLGTAELFFVSAEMADLAKVAADSMPDFTLMPEDLPARSGLIYFDKPIDEFTDDLIGDEPTQTSIVAASWSHWREAPSSWPHGGVWITWYSDREANFRTTPAMDPALERWYRNCRSRLLLDNETPQPFSPDPMKAVLDGEIVSYRDVVADDSSTLRWVGVLKATWLLMQQSVATVTSVQPDRAARKRIRRSGSEPSLVRVIELRRPAHSGSGDGSREFHHQWIVRGHWRQQWYPARQVHRPVWIAPHIKGPEGAPLLGGEKVYAWKR